jgi:transketolase
VRVVSLPSTDTFLAQDAAYRESVLPSAVRARVAVEAGHSESWFRFIGLDGKVVGIDRYGLSAPGADALKALGMTVENVTAAVLAAMEERA